MLIDTIMTLNTRLVNSFVAFGTQCILQKDKQDPMYSKP